MRNTYLFLFVIISCCMLSCSSNTLFIPGQEGLETVHKHKQIKAAADINYNNGNSNGHLEFNYSPIKNVGVIYDLKTAGLDYQYHTLAMGYYFENYESVGLAKPTKSKTSMDIGYHFDAYVGATYARSEENTFYRNSNFTTAESYGVNLFGKRYFGQIGFHLKKEHMSYDIVLRRVWLDIDKIQTFGLAISDDFNPGQEIRDENPLSFTELSFKVNIGGVHKPLYIGLSRKLGLSDSNVINSTFDYVVGFIGVNLDIYQVFQKNRSSTN